MSSGSEKRLASGVLSKFADLFYKLAGNIAPSNFAIDLGTANTIVYEANKGIVLDQPSIVAVKNEFGVLTPCAFGEQAKLMVGRTTSHVNAIRPLRDGVIADFKIAEEMIAYFIKEVKQGSVFFFKPIIVICVPSTSTSVERRAIQDAAESAGAREAYLIEEPMAAAIGAGLKVTDPSGCMIVDIGGGTAEIAVLSLGGVVYGNSLRIGGDKMDEAIILYVKKKFNLLIGEYTAEKVKKEIGCSSVDKDKQPKTMKVRGRDVIDGIPKEIEISQKDMAIALEECVGKIIDAIKLALESTPPELSADIVEKGVVLTGGGALLENLDKSIKNAIGLDVYIAENPLHCVAKGSGYVIENMEKYKNILFRQE